MTRRHECANCGRDVRDIPDAERRFEGGKWYCSQSCFLTAESASPSSVRKPSKPRRKWRRRIGWTVGVIVALIVGLSVLGAFVDTSSTTSGASDKRSGKSAGKESSPVALGHYGGVWGGWRLRLTAYTPHAFEYDYVYPRKLPLGASEVMVAATARYAGGGSADLADLTRRIYVTGSHNATYQASTGDGSCSPRRLTEQQAKRALQHTFTYSSRQVFSGTSVTGRLCFEIATNDLPSLRLYVDPTDCSSEVSDCKHVWFALKD
jgi:hypothetical protein